MSIQTPYIELTSLDIDNHIINGGMNFWQRTANTVSTALSPNGYGYNGADRFFTQLVNSSTVSYTTQRSTDVPTVSQANVVFPFSHLVTVTASDSLTGTTTVIPFGYRMEGVDYARLHGRTATLSFWVKTNKPGQYSVAFHSASQLRSYVSDFIINNSATWEQKFITIQFESVISGDYSFGTAMGLEIVFCAFSGAAYTTSTLNQWTFDAVHEKNNSNLSQNIFDTNGNTIQFAGIKLNLGPVASPFTLAGRQYTQELRLCQRYYHKTYSVDEVPGTVDSQNTYLCGANYSTSGPQGVIIPWQYPSPMLSVPTLIAYNASTGAIGSWRDSGGTDYSVTISGSGANGAEITIASVIATREISGHFTAEAEL